MSKKIKVTGMKVKDNHISTYQYLAFYDRDEADAELAKIRRSSKGTKFEHEFDRNEAETAW